MTQSENKQPDAGALIAQLAELNNRSRWYAAQIWHLPFAYFGILVVTGTQILTNKNDYLPHFLISFGIFGFFVLWHIIGIYNGTKRAVEDIQKIEALLNLETTAEFKKWYVLPLIVILGVGVSASILFGFYLLKCNY